MLKTQTKNKVDIPTLMETLKELGILSVIVGALYFLTEIQTVEFGIYAPVIVAAAKVLTKFIEQFKRGLPTKAKG